MIATLRALKAMVEKILLTILPAFPFMAPFAALMALLASIEANYSTLVSGINSLSAHVRTMPAAHWLGQANRIVPLTEILAMLATLLAFKATAFTVRFVKSWIPTVN